MKTDNNDRIIQWKLYDQQTQFIGSPEHDVDHARSIINNANRIGYTVERIVKHPTLFNIVVAPFRISKDMLDIVVHASVESYQTVFKK